MEIITDNILKEIKKEIEKEFPNETLCSSCTLPEK